MTDFNAPANDAVPDPITLFEGLPKPGLMRQLRPAQAEILERWYAIRNQRRDVIIELGTGCGKTLVGLLIAYLTGLETGCGCLYLVENRQLADQVVEQARQVGIPAVAYKSASERKETGAPALSSKFKNGEEVLVGSYHALFGGTSAFGIAGDPSWERLGGIVVDDAHASLAALRDIFSVTIPAKDTVAYRQILAEFKEAFDALEHSSTYCNFLEGEGRSVLEMPYPYWKKAMNPVSSILRKARSEKAKANVSDDLSRSLAYSWPLIENKLKYCQVVISKDSIIIAAMYPLLQMLPSFLNAERRVYMSATITDYGDLMRTFDLRALQEGDIIAPESGVEAGRRMVVLAYPDSLNSEEFAELVKEEIEAGRGVVKLSPRSEGSITEVKFLEPMGHDDVSAALEALKGHTTEKPVAFINRYNGIDLPGDACKILILDGVPLMDGGVDAIMYNYLPNSDITSQRIAQKIEQGVGRGVRGEDDRCVVILTGHDLLDRLKDNKSVRFFSPAFQAQIKKGEEDDGQVMSPEELCFTVRRALDADEGWPDSNAEVFDLSASSNLGASAEGARVERKAFGLWSDRQPESAVACIKEAIGAEPLKSDRDYRGWLLSIASRIAFDGNMPAAAKLSREASKANSRIPNVGMPGLDVSEVAPDWALAQAEKISEQAVSVRGTDVLTRFDGDMAALSAQADPAQFEEALCRLGAYLGFDAKREDKKGNGPDVRWVDVEANVGWAIEAKSGKLPENPLDKEEAGQLRTARSWMKQQWEGIEAVAVSVHPNALAYRNASAADLDVLTLDALDELKSDVRTLLEQVQEVPLNERPQEVAHLLIERKMGIKGLADRYLVEFKDDSVPQDDSVS